MREAVQGLCQPARTGGEGKRRRAHYIRQPADPGFRGQMPFATRATWWLWKTRRSWGRSTRSAAAARRLAGVPDGGRSCKPGRAGGRVCRAGKAALFSTASPISRTPRARPEPCSAGPSMCLRCGTVCPCEGRPYGSCASRAGRCCPSKACTEGAVIYAGSFSKFVPGHAPCVLRLRQKLMAAFVVAKKAATAHQRVGAARVCEAMLTRTDMDRTSGRYANLRAAKAALMMEQAG